MTPQLVMPMILISGVTEVPEWRVSSFGIILKIEINLGVFFLFKQVIYLFSFFNAHLHREPKNTSQISAFTLPPQINPSGRWNWLLIPVKIMASLISCQHFSCLSLLRQGKKTIEAKYIHLCLTLKEAWK